MASLALPAVPGRIAPLEATYRRITWRLLPFLTVLCVPSWIDRANIGFAKLRMLAAPLHCGLPALVGDLVPTSPVAAMLALALAIVGTVSAIPGFRQMPGRLLAGSAAAAGIAPIASVANLAGFGAPAAMGYLRERPGSVSTGPRLVAAGEPVAIVLILAVIPRLRSSTRSSTITCRCCARRRASPPTAVAEARSRVGAGRVQSPRAHVADGAKLALRPDHAARHRRRAPEAEVGPARSTPSG